MNIINYAKNSSISECGFSLRATLYVRAKFSDMEGLW